MLNPGRPDVGTIRRELERRARRSGWPEPLVLLTTPDDPGAGQARRALAAAPDLVVVSGGDGTVRHVAGEMAGTGVPIGIVPTGTANLLARNLGLPPRRPLPALRIALEGTTADIDVGLASVTTGGHPDRWSPDMPFLVMAGLGRDAQALSTVGPHLQRALGWTGYLVAGARRLLAPAVPMVLTTDTGTRRVKVWTVLVGNCPRIPAGIEVFPAARPDDGVLDTLEVPVHAATDWLGVAARGLLHLRRDVPALVYGRTTTVRLAPSRPLPLQLDGDVVAEVTEVRIRVRPGALTVRVPIRRHRSLRPASRSVEPLRPASRSVEPLRPTSR